MLSALPPLATGERTSRIGRFVPIVLQKSQIDSRRFFREKTKQAAIVDGYGVKFVSEVACEFIAVR
jgi:hypothetical protein